MKKVYTVEEDREMHEILNDTYEEMMAIVMRRNPKAKSLSDDEEIVKIHDLLALLRLGHLRVSYIEPFNARHVVLEISDK
jgi:hypothetical protein